VVTAAMVADEEAAVPVDAQGSSAAAAVRHDGIIGEPLATDRPRTSSRFVAAIPEWMPYSFAGPSCVFISV